MLSKKALYAIRALVVLANAAPAARTTSDIVRERGLPRKFLEAILIELKQADITESVRGRDGGHRLSRPPKAISLAEVVRAIDGPLAMMPCASVTRYSPCTDCPDVERCHLRRAFSRGRDALAGVLEGATLHDLIDDAATPAP